tara:strand:+ start:200 stop:490 length:291 start_codon:yes stop_codon:yes gene_type:complete
MTKLIINGIMNDEDILWKKLKCKCDKSDIEKTFPLGNCKHCQCQSQEDSMPRDSFKVNQNEIDKDGKDTGKVIVKEIKEITIDREPIYNSIRGWLF